MTSYITKAKAMFSEISLDANGNYVVFFTSMNYGEQVKWESRYRLDLEKNVIRLQAQYALRLMGIAQDVVDSIMPDYSATVEGYVRIALSKIKNA